jgi:hypothetical protein
VESFLGHILNQLLTFHIQTHFARLTLKGKGNLTYTHHSPDHPFFNAKSYGKVIELYGQNILVANNLPQIRLGSSESPAKDH